MQLKENNKTDSHEIGCRKTLKAFDQTMRFQISVFLVFYRCQRNLSTKMPLKLINANGIQDDAHSIKKSKQ